MDSIRLDLGVLVYDLKASVIAMVLGPTSYLTNGYCWILSSVWFTLDIVTYINGLLFVLLL